MIFVMTLTQEGRPAHFYEHKLDGNSPPWAFSGYAKMQASSLEEAEEEFKAAERQYWAQVYDAQD